MYRNFDPLLVELKFLTVISAIHFGNVDRELPIFYELFHRKYTRAAIDLSLKNHSVHPRVEGERNARNSPIPIPPFLLSFSFVYTLFIRGTKKGREVRPWHSSKPSLSSLYRAVEFSATLFFHSSFGPAPCQGKQYSSLLYSLPPHFHRSAARFSESGFAMNFFSGVKRIPKDTRALLALLVFPSGIFLCLRPFEISPITIYPMILLLLSFKITVLDVPNRYLTLTSFIYFCRN